MTETDKVLPMNCFTEMEITAMHQGTADVIINSFINIGLDELTQGKKCFINFTESLLKMKLPSYFNPSSIVVEILEDVPITEELIDLCAEMKKLGYTIALDDFNLQQNYFRFQNY
ncbi:MAG: hypothetical protein ACQEWW_14685 [Bacillota bacterium]